MSIKGLNHLYLPLQEESYLESARRRTSGLSINLSPSNVYYPYVHLMSRCFVTVYTTNLITKNTFLLKRLLVNVFIDQILL